MIGSTKATIAKLCVLATICMYADAYACSIKQSPTVTSSGRREMLSASFNHLSILQKSIPTSLHASTKSSSALYTTSAASDFPLNSKDDIAISRINSNVRKPSFPVVLWRFTRPHTLVGSALAIPALHLIAAPNLQAALTVKTLYSILYATIPALLMNLYITGLNQITDVEIDKINKPNLPIPAGHLREGTAIAIVLVSLVASLWLGLASPYHQYTTNGLQVALLSSGILGTLYSLPPFRLKRFHLLAAFCIVAVRGAVINAGFYAHAQAAAFGNIQAGFGVLQSLATQPRCLYSSMFFGVFAVVIALMKDVPDVIGDKIANIKTFSVRLGAKEVFNGMRRLLTALFIGCSIWFGKASFEATTRGLTLCRGIVTVAALVAGFSVREQAKPVNPQDSGQVYKYYMHLWKLFYLSYLVLPFAR